MLSYMAISGALEGVGLEDVVALVTDDGERTVVYGEGDVADDLRDSALDLEPGDPDLRLKLLAHGLSYYRIQGPYHTRSDIHEGSYLARAYGLS